MIAAGVPGGLDMVLIAIVDCGEGGQLRGGMPNMKKETIITHPFEAIAFF